MTDSMKYAPVFTTYIANRSSLDSRLAYPEMSLEFMTHDINLRYLLALAANTEHSKKCDRKH